MNEEQKNIEENSGIQLETPEYEVQYFASRITPKFFEFITLEMLVTIVAFGSVIYFLRDFLINGFTTNIGLNSSIIIVFIYSLALLIRNNLSLHALAKFIHSIEDIELTKTLRKENIIGLKNDLTKRGQLIDTHATSSIISHMDLNGFFCINIDEGKDIRHFFHDRINVRRGHISFLSSVLVTLGLIGTFWGLILTISEIGDTLGTISAMFSSNTGESPNLGKLIDGISGPLQGMGVAFSSSLFGLAGSLIVNVIGILANKAQNKFSEKLSRWIDEHIPEINLELAERIHREGDSVLPPEIIKDHEEIMKAFVLLSRDTHRHLNILANRLDALNKHTVVQEKAIDEIANMRTSYMDIRKNMNKHEKTLASIFKTAVKDIKKQQNIGFKDLSKQLENTQKVTKSFESLAETTKTIYEKQGEFFKLQSKTTEELSLLNSHFEKLNDKEETTNKALNAVAHVLTGLSQQLKKQDETNEKLVMLLERTGIQR